MGGQPRADPEAEVAEAIKLSQASDGMSCLEAMAHSVVTILCVGTNHEWESEGYDRDDIASPPGVDDLIRAVLASTPDCIIANQSGMPVELPWLDKATTVLQGWFGGNDCGTGIADAIFGKINPGGKMPVTWPKKLEDVSSNEGFAHPVRTVYSEGVFMGYRAFDQPGRPSSMIPFGFGLSYSTFAVRSISSQAFPCALLTPAVI